MDKKIVTERKKAEEAVHKGEEHVRNVIENIFKFVPEGLLVFTDKLNLFKKNKAFQDIIQNYSGKLDYTKEKLEEIIIKEVKKRIMNGDHTEIRISKKRR
ncbi:hypothetical protein KKC91_12120 [bacterium]|nr:hypothetical protein [bacterium]